VYSEQGFGDSLQHLRFIPLLNALGVGRLCVLLQPELLAVVGSLRLFAEFLPVSRVPEGFDFSVSLLSLPHRLQMDWPTLPAWGSYLAPQSGRVDYWRDRLMRAGIDPGGSDRPYLVGIAWRGSSGNARDQHRSMSLSELAMLAMPGVRLVSLQKGPAAVEVRANPSLQVLPFGEDCADFGDSAALISLLDLVVSVDTSVAHLAGALGHPACVLDARPDSRWLIGRADSPWYPSVKIFVQQMRGDWRPTVLELAYDVQQREQAWRRSAKIAPPEAPAATSFQQDLADARQSALTRPNSALARLALAQQLKARQHHLEALWSFQHALALDDRLGEGHLGLGTLLRAQGVAFQALPHHLRAVARMPRSAAAALELAESHFAANDPVRALRRAAEALALDGALELARVRVATCLRLISGVLAELQPSANAWLARPDWHNTVLLADTLLALGVPCPAIGMYRLAADPNAVQAAVLRGLSTSLSAEQEWMAVLELAGPLQRAGLEREPELWCDQATAAWQAGELELAERHFAALLEQHPRHLVALVHASALAIARQHLALAEARAQAAALLAPDDPDALRAVAAVLDTQGHVPEAAAVLEHLLLVDPTPATRLQRSALALRSGDWARGWVDYEARLDSGELAAWIGVVPGGPLPPRWRGDDLRGRHLLIVAEQGLGDTLQFLRCLPLLAALRPARVTLQVQNELAPWLAESLQVPGFPWFEVWPRSALPLPAFHLFCPLLSLPGLLGLRPNAVPPPWLPAVDPLQREVWRSWLDHRAGRPVGLCWAGSSQFRGDRERSVGLAAVAPLLALTENDWISLQFGPAGRAAEGMGARCPELSPGQGFRDTAALVAECALVITPDTAIAHLAAGLGIPTWILLPYAAEWRWGLDQGATPWYPSARLFRQPQPGDWPSVVAAVGTALAGGS
jgi:tetratricopeptide (TPR) repeat protein